jgi:hypothetical protein
MVNSTTGLHHYRVSKDILPPPLSYTLFKGRFQTVQPGDELDYHKCSSSSRHSSQG